MTTGQKIVDALYEKLYEQGVRNPTKGQVEDLVDSAIAAEREACAREVERFGEGLHTGNRILLDSAAKAVRQRRTT